MERPAPPPHCADSAVLLISDLDGTLVGDDETLRRFNCHWISQQLPRGSVLTYNTARDKPAYVELLHQETQGMPELLRPDVLILAEGTEIWRFGPGGGEPSLDETWHAELLANWDAKLVKTECA